MKTKEQILEKYYNQNVGLNTFKFNQVIEAMEEYKNQYLHPPQTEAWFEVPIAEREPERSDKLNSQKYFTLPLGTYSRFNLAGKFVNYNAQGILGEVSGVTHWLEKRPVRPVAALPDVVGFAEWANKNYTYVDLNKWDGDNDETFTTYELHSLYINQVLK